MADINGEPCDNPKLALVEACCISYFTIEFLFRFAGSPGQILSGDLSLVQIHRDTLIGSDRDRDSAKDTSQGTQILLLGAFLAFRCVVSMHGKIQYNDPSHNIFFLCLSTYHSVFMCPLNV